MTTLLSTLTVASLLAATSTPAGPHATPGDVSDTGPVPTNAASPSTVETHRQSPRWDAPPPPRPPSDRFKAKRLSTTELRGARSAVAVGGALFGVFYLGATLVGASNLDDIYDDGQVTPDERDKQRLSRLVFVPVLGPIVAAPLGESKGDTAALMAHGIFQGLAAAALISGGVALARDRRARRLALSAGWSASGVSIGLRGRF